MKVDMPLNKETKPNKCAHIYKFGQFGQFDPLQLPFTSSWPSPTTHHFQLVLKVRSHIGTELLYVGFCCSSCLCLSMWRGPQEYDTYKFIPTSPAVSHMSGSSNLDSFLWWVVSGRTPAALRGAASRTCSLLLAAFLFSYRQAFSQYV